MIKLLSESSRSTRQEVEEYQFHKIKEKLIQIQNHNSFYRRKMEIAQVSAEDIHSINDLYMLPYTYKKDLISSYPYGYLLIHKNQIKRVHTSSGTSGTPTVSVYSMSDLEQWTSCMKRSLIRAGITSHDVIQIAYNYGTFTGGIGMHYGAEACGATVVPTSTGNTSMQIRLLIDLNVTVLMCTPSYALHLLKEVENKGKLEELKVKKLILGAEPWSEETRRYIHHNYDIQAYDIYGLSELMGPGIACECEQANGMHVLEDQFFAEIIDPESGGILPHGELGELVLTSFNREAMPLIRYRTGDMCKLITGTCSCGSEFQRISKISGRSDDMMVIKGVNVFPSQVEGVLFKCKQVNKDYLIVLQNRDYLDEVIIYAEIVDNSILNNESLRKEITDYLLEELYDELRIKVSLVLKEKGSLYTDSIKKQRIIRIE